MASASSDCSSEFLATFRSVLSSIGRADEQGELGPILALHKLVSQHALSRPRAVEERLCGRLAEARAVAEESGCEELIRLLSSPHVVAVAAVHDNVAGRLYEPLLPPIPHEVDEDEGVAVKIVRMVKNDEPLGATIKCHDDGSVTVARVMKGGVADRSGCIQVGDTVLEVNGIGVEKKNPAEILKLLSVSTNGTVTFKLIPALDMSSSTGHSSSSEALGGIEGQRRRSFVRALFDYDPSRDNLHPCPEAGLAFRSGQVIQLLDTSDEHWWQGREEGGFGGDEDGRVGLIPSGRLEEKRHVARSASSASSREKRPRKLMYETRASDDFVSDEVRSYEEVGLLYPRPGLTRPIVLIGAPGVGRNELKRRLLMLNPDRFASTVPHTSRSPKAGEQEGVDYHFVSRPQMEAYIRSGDCIEYGEYRGNLYGTLGSTVRAIGASGRTAVLNPHPQALRLLRSADVKPLVVLVAPPPFPALKESRAAVRAASSSSAHSHSPRLFTDQDLQGLIAASNALKSCAGAIDYVLVNGSLEFAFRELCDLVQRLDRDPSWVPLEWIR